MGRLTRKLARRVAAGGKEKLDTLVDELGQRLVATKEFEDVNEWFLDHLAEHPGFVAASEEGTNETLSLAIEQVAARLDLDVGRAALWMAQVAGKGMWHGCAAWQVERCMFFYFEELDVGLASFVLAPAGSRTHFFRFSVLRDVQPTLTGPLTRGEA